MLLQKTWTTELEMALKLEMDSSDIWNEMIYCVRKVRLHSALGFFLSCSMKSDH